MKFSGNWIVLSSLLMTGMFLVLPIETASAQESIDIEVTQDSATVDPRTGEVTISGTVTCSAPLEAQVYGGVNQPVGRTDSVEGFGYGAFYCDKDGQPYSFSLFPYRGRFAPGRAVITVDAYVCNEFTCDGDRLQQSTRITPAGG